MCTSVILALLTTSPTDIPQLSKVTLLIAECIDHKCSFAIFQNPWVNINSCGTTKAAAAENDNGNMLKPHVCVWLSDHARLHHSVLRIETKALHGANFLARACLSWPGPGRNILFNSKPRSSSSGPYSVEAW